jgi:ubiquinone/menaquinone biosynthesis C-methylase UbiE
LRQHSEASAARAFRDRELSVSESHDDVVRREFARQEPSFARADAYYASLGDGTVAALQPLARDQIVLDVACGAAHASEAVAPHVRQVVGADLTPALLAAGARRLAERGARNVLLQEANAARLPFADASFDLVFCRAAVHHFAEPEAQVREMARVCRSGGRVVLLDMVPPSAAVRARFDALHREIDPSHASCLLEEELAQLLARCVGARAATRRSRSAPVSFEVFEHQSATARPEMLERVRESLRREARGGEATGFEPLEGAGGALQVHLTSAVASAVRP